MEAELTATRSKYTQTVSNLFNGMFVEISKQYPEMAGKIEKAASQYNILSSLLAMPDYKDVGDKVFTDYNNKIFEMAKQAGYLEKLDLSYAASLDQIGNPLAFMTNLKEQIEADLRDSYIGMSDNPILADLFARILDNQLITENLDLTNLQGALDGVAKSLDFAQAGQKALDEGNANLYGQYLVLGLGQGITDNAHLIEPSFIAVRDAALAALQAAFIMYSPSQLMAQQGIFISEGLAIGITNGAPIVLASISAIGAQMIAAFTNVGDAMISGMVSGLMSGQSRVTAAARQVALSAYNAAKSALGIKSPSKVFEQLGIYTAEGYALGIESGYTMVGRALEGLLPDVDKHVWGLIDSFNGLELSDTDMKSVRKLAEREVINRFTTPKINVEFTAHNNINSKLDIDEVMDEFGRAIEDALIASAEGVHI